MEQVKYTILGETEHHFLEGSQALCAQPSKCSMNVPILKWWEVISWDTGTGNVIFWWMRKGIILKD